MAFRSSFSIPKDLGHSRAGAMCEFVKTYYRKAKGSLLVYDVTNRSSFLGLEAWHKHLDANADPRCVSIVTGNKSDMPAQDVAPEEGLAYAAQRGMKFLSTSAKAGDNVEEAFVTLARSILQAGHGKPSLDEAKSHRLHASLTMAQTDREVLVALYNATGGAAWKNKRNWNSDAALSQWYGVESDTQGRVVKPALDFNNLRGRIPPELGNLTTLQILSLRGNKLSGGPRTNESISAWKTRLQAKLAKQECAEQERAGRERTERERAERERAGRERAERESAERERAEENARMEGERQRAKEVEREEMVRRAGDVGRWLHQDLGFDDDRSTIFGANLRTRHLHDPTAIYALDQRTLEAVLRDVEMPELLAALVTEAWHRRRKEDEDRRRAEAETALVAARERAESAAEERSRREEEEYAKKQRGRRRWRPNGNVWK